MKRYVMLTSVPLLIALSVSAQIPMTRMPDMPTEFKIPRVGSWSRYRSINSEEGDTTIFKYSLTGKEKFGKIDCYWYEFQTTEGEKISIVKMLISGDPDEPGNLKRLILKNGDEPAVEIPVGMTHSAGIAASRTGESEDIEAVSGRDLVTVGRETLTTDAGKINCTHLRIKNQEKQIDFWASESIPFFSIARSVHSGLTMEITGYGESGAKTAITEKPKKMPKPGIGR